MLAILLFATCGSEPQLKVEDKVTPKCAVCGPTCPCPAGVCADGKCPVVVRPVVVGGPALGRSSGAVRVKSSTVSRVALVEGGGFYLRDGLGWWPGKALGRLPRR